MKTCKMCSTNVRDGASHYCSAARRTIEADNHAFLISMAVAQSTGDADLGIAAGGSAAGAIIGSDSSGNGE